MTESPTRPIESAEQPPPQRRWDRPIQVGTAVVAGSAVLFGTLSIVAFAMIKTEHESHTFTTAVRQVEVTSDTGDVRVTTRASASTVVLNTRTRSAFSRPEHGAAVSDGVLEVTGSCPAVAIFDN